jgi:hypothetical protein
MMATDGALCVAFSAPLVLCSRHPRLQVSPEPADLPGWRALRARYYDTNSKLQRCRADNDRLLRELKLYRRVSADDLLLLQRRAPHATFLTPMIRRCHALLLPHLCCSQLQQADDKQRELQDALQRASFADRLTRRLGDTDMVRQRQGLCSRPECGIFP